MRRPASARIPRLVTVVAAFAALFAAPIHGRALAQAPPPLFQNWLNNLTAAGYGISQGTANIFTKTYCDQYILPTFGNCFNNDPTDPYITPFLPTGNAYIDPYFGPSAAITLPNGTVAGQDFFLAPTEAALVIVNLQPQAAYFGYQTYLFSRLNADYPHGVVKASPDPARGLLFATFNNSVNDKTIQLQNQLLFGPGTVAFITTPNPALAADMTSRFAAVQGNPNLIFTDQIGSTLNIGIDFTSDDFLTVMRYLVPANAAAAKSWVKGAASNVLVYRIDQPPSVAVQRFGPTTVADKSYNAAESTFAADITELSQLAQTWLATQEQKSHFAIKTAAASEQVSPAGVGIAGTYGPYCISTGNYCVGADNDTATYWDAGVGKIPVDNLFIVDGVDHTVTNNSTQMSVSVIDETTNTGTGAAVQTNPAAAGFTAGTLTGSAAAFLHDTGLWAQASPTLRSDSPNLYVHIFTRGCTTQQSYCTASYTTLVPSRTIPYADYMGITVRAYLLPGFLDGANPYYLVQPNAIF